MIHVLWTVTILKCPYIVKKENRKMIHVLWTVTILKCPYIPKVFIYTRAVKFFIINRKTIFTPPSTGPQSRPSCTVNQFKKKLKKLQWQINYYI